MPLHHFLPPPHVVGFLLTAGLAFTAGAILMSRRRAAGSFAHAGATLKNRLRSWRDQRGSDGFGTRMSAMFAKCSNARAERWNSTGNAAFEAYRSATLTELEQEAAAFRKYLDELRHAKDKSEFDTFLDERRRTPANETSTP